MILIVHGRLDVCKSVEAVKSGEVDATLSKRPCGVDVGANTNRQDVQKPLILRQELLQQLRDIVIAADEDSNAVVDVLIRAAVNYT